MMSISPRKILIVDKVSPSLILDLTAHGFVCETQLSITYQDFLNMPDEWYGLVIRSRFIVDKELIDSKSQLHFIARLGSGVENIDTDYAKNKGIACISTPEGNAQAVAEHALALLLCALKNVVKADKEVRQGIWDREANKGHELSSLKVGIIGFGHTGPAFAKILHHFGIEIFVYDKYKSHLATDYVHEVDLYTLQQQCDVISLHINYFAENKYFINDIFWKSVKHNVIFLNTSRGNVVDTASLVRQLHSGKVQYACLDVLEYESVNLKNVAIEQWSPTMYELAHFPNVVLSPHIAGQTFEAEQKHADIAVQKILALGD